MTKTRFLAFLTALVLLLTIPTAVFAQSTIPHQFFGSATLDGATAPDGTAITVWVDGSQVGATNLVNGSYSLQVGGEDGFAGKTVVFKVAAATAEQTLDWERGGVSELNLTASSSTNTTTPPVADGEGEKGDKGDTGARGATGADGADGALTALTALAEPPALLAKPALPVPRVFPVWPAMTAVVERSELSLSS